MLGIAALDAQWATTTVSRQLSAAEGTLALHSSSPQWRFRHFGTSGAPTTKRPTFSVANHHVHASTSRWLAFVLAVALWSAWDQAHHLEQFAMPHLPKPEGALIGGDKDGKYRTARAKEYPSQQSACFAYAFWQRIQQRIVRVTQADVDPFAKQLASWSSRVDLAKDMRHDYQPI